MNDGERLESFRREAIGEAESIARAMDAETDALYKERVAKAEEALVAEMYAYIQERVGRIKREKGAKASKASAGAREELLRFSEGAVGGIHRRVGEMLAEFAASAGYAEWLRELLLKSLPTAGAGCEVLHTSADSRFVDSLREATEGAGYAGVTFTADPSVKIGGLILRSRERAVVVDESLGSRYADAGAGIARMIGPRLK